VRSQVSGRLPLAICQKQGVSHNNIITFFNNTLKPFNHETIFTFCRRFLVYDFAINFFLKKIQN